MERDSNQCLKRFAFSDSASAGIGSLLAEEKRMRSYCSRAGRPICSGENRKSSNNGGHKNEEINLGPAVEPAGAESGVISMDGIVFSALKLYGIDVDHKIICQLSGQEVA
jgi:hypothetical protein